MSFLPSTIFDSILRFVSKTYDKLDTLATGVSNKKTLWAIVVLLCFSVILFLNILTPMIADDFGYLYVFGEKVQVASLSDIIRSQVTHYKWWGGRSVVHFIAQALLQMPSLVADLLNSAVYMLFVILVYLHIKGRNKDSRISLFVLINLATWFVLPMFGDTVLWITGSANYLWGTTIVLLFLLPYRLYNGAKYPVGMQILASVSMFIFGLIAGWTNENTVAGMIVIILLFFLFYRARGWKLSPTLCIGLVGVLVGYAIMILAPGNFFRGREAPSLSLLLIGYRAFMYTQSLFLNYGALLALYLVFFVLLGYRTNSNKGLQSVSVIYLLGGVGAIYVMVFSPQFPSRAWFGLVTYFLIALGIVFDGLDLENRVAKQMRTVIIVVGCIAFLFSLVNVTRDVYRIYEIDKEREIIAEKAREAGEEVCYFKRFIPNTSYVHGEDVQSNMLLSYYYGIFVEYED